VKGFLLNSNFFVVEHPFFIIFVPTNYRMKKLNFFLLLSAFGFIIGGAVFNLNGSTSNVLNVGPPVGVNIGNTAPDLSFKNPEGKEIRLSSLRGSVVLLDFWASWCRPCRMENPNVVSAYNKYSKAKFKDAKGGFTIYNVSLDMKKDAWVDAIKKDGLVWENHVSDLGGWGSQAAAIYGVQSIPANYLIDAKGVIVAKNLRGTELDAQIEKLVKQ